MSEAKTIAINGVHYDTGSGLPTGETSSVQNELRRNRSVHAAGVHTRHQRSKTLNRSFVKKSHAPNHAIKKSTRSMDVRPKIQRSPHITKFAPTYAEPATHTEDDTHVVVKHPLEKKTAHVAPTHHRQTPASRPTNVIKHAAVASALENATSHDEKAPKESKRRLLNVASVSLALLLLAGYFTYINMPSLSVRVAAAQAGIDATYPDYRPVGYRLNGPVAFSDGEVTMQFASNSGPLGFAIKQSNSTWDSAALLENYVDPKSKGSYATYSDAGLTIYTYGTNAAWVNGGILYTINGSAALSNEQVRRIATSM